MAKAKHKDFSTMSDDELRSFCQALDAVARKAEAKMLNRRTSSFPSTEHDRG